MRPAFATPTLFALTFILVAFVHAAPLPALADEALREAEASFVDASFERLLEELGLSVDGEVAQPEAARVFCEQMCARFRAGGLISVVDCPARCGAAPARTDEPQESTEGAGARSDIDVSRNNSAAVVPTTAAGNARP
jgi:hypothetical protein